MLYEYAVFILFNRDWRASKPLLQTESRKLHFVQTRSLLTICWENGGIGLYLKSLSAKFLLFQSSFEITLSLVVVYTILAGASSGLLVIAFS